MIKNEKATTDFIKAVQSNNDLLLKITNHMDNHMNIDPENVNYGHVGSAGHVNNLLKEMCEFLEIK